MGDFLLDGTSLHEGRRGWAVAVITILQGKSFSKDYDYRSRIKEPLFTVSPVVGADVYFLLVLLLTLEYNFRMGIAGKISGEIEKTNSRGTGFVRSNGMRQTVSVGVKVNFPFTITQTDGNSILQWLDEVIFGKE